MAEANVTVETTESTEGAAQETNQTQTQTEGSNTSSAAGNNGEKTFTQAEVNEMIEKRLARERKKYNTA